MDEDSGERPSRRTLGELYQSNVLKERELALKNRDISLKYGSPGTVHYDVENGRWEFSRRMVPGRFFQAIGGIEVPIPSPTEASSTSLPSSQFDPRKKSDIIQTHPEASLAAEILAQDESISNEISNAANHYDPALSNRLAFGYAATPQRLGRNAYNPRAPGIIPIIAIVGGMCGDKVKLVVHKKIDFGWTLRSGTNLRVPEIHGDECWWFGGGAPVQQIKASQSSEKNDARFAVQSAASTTILRPVYNRYPVRITQAAGHETSEMHLPLRLDPNPVATITSTMTGGAVHADASFNPWYPRQIAIMDRRMKWSIWDVEGKAPADVTAGPTGNLCTDGYHDSEKPEVDPVDGWGCVCWVAVDKLIVCNRRTLAVYYIADEAVKLRSRGLDFLLESEWILEVKNDPANLSDIFVLTSARIIWLRIGSTETNEEGLESEARGQYLLSWRHFRTADDVSLSLHILQEDTSDVVLIYSRLNPLASIYRFSIPSEDSSIPASLSDPSQLILGLNPLSHLSECRQLTRMSTVTIQKIGYRDQSGEPREKRPWDIGLKYSSMGVEFYKITILSSELSVREQLYAARAIPRSDIRQQPQILEIQPPLVRKATNAPTGSYTSGLSAVKVSIDDDFVTQEDHDIFLAHSPLVQLKGPTRRRRIGSTVERRDWTVDYESVYNAVSGPETLEVQEQSFESCVEDLRNWLISNKKKLCILSTLYELLGKNVLVSDFANLATPNLRDLITPGTNSSLQIFVEKLITIRLIKTWLWLPNSIQSTSGEHTELNGSNTSFYTYLIQGWLTNMPQDPSNLARNTEEMILKRVASDISLASVCLAPGTSSRMPGALNGAILERKGHLPVRGKNGIPNGKEKDHEHRNPVQFSSPGPVPLRASQDSIVDDEDTVCSPLREYTTVKRIFPLPKLMATVLAHWNLGESPHSYDWERMETEIAKPSAAELESQERQQTKLRRRKEQVVEHASRFAFVSDEQAPMKKVFGSQQSQPVRPSVLTSSQAVDEPRASTQTEKDQFRGRGSLVDQTQKARKKRKSGF